MLESLSQPKHLHDIFIKQIQASNAQYKIQAYSRRNLNSLDPDTNPITHPVQLPLPPPYKEYINVILNEQVVFTMDGGIKSFGLPGTCCSCDLMEYYQSW
jgi:hypothetical protein